MARPRFEPTEEQRKAVKLMVAAGIPEEDIAKVIGPKGISPVTLRKYFREEIETGAITINAKIAGRLYAIACQSGDLKSATTAAIWWTKTRMGWSEKKGLEHTGKDGGPIAIEGGMPAIEIIIEGDGEVDGGSAEAEE